MFELRIAEIQRKWKGNTTGEGETEEWVTTHNITVPDRKTLGAILDALSAEFRERK